MPLRSRNRHGTSLLFLHDAINVPQRHSEDPYYPLTPPRCTLHSRIVECTILYDLFIFPFGSVYFRSLPAFTMSHIIKGPQSYSHLCIYLTCHYYCFTSYLWTLRNMICGSWQFEDNQAAQFSIG